MKHNHEPFDHYEESRKDWTYALPFVVAMVFACWVIYSAMLLLEAVMVLNG